MARNPQTQAKRAREAALKEKRERKQAKKADRRAAAAEGTAGELESPPASDESGQPADADDGAAE